MISRLLSNSINCRSFFECTKNLSYETEDAICSTVQESEPPAGGQATMGDVIPAKAGYKKTN